MKKTEQFNEFIDDNLAMIYFFAGFWIGAIYVLLIMYAIK